MSQNRPRFRLAFAERGLEWLWQRNVCASASANGQVLSAMNPDPLVRDGSLCMRETTKFHAKSERFGAVGQVFLRRCYPCHVLFVWM